MSTKIYNGLSLPPMTALELAEWAVVVRKQITKIISDSLHKRAVEATVALHDCYKLGIPVDSTMFSELGIEIKTKDGKPNPFSYWSVAKGIIVFSNKLPEKYLYTFALAAFPLIDRILLIPFAKISSIYQYLLKLPGVSEYGYWNNTDQPEEVSDEEWEQRRNNWNAVFDKYGDIPQDSALMIHVENAYLETQSFEPFIPSLQKRAEQFAHEQVCGTYINEFAKGEKITDANAGRLYRQAIEEMAKESSKKIIADREEEIRNILKTEITVSYLQETKLPTEEEIANMALLAKAN